MNFFLIDFCLILFLDQSDDSKTSGGPEWQAPIAPSWTSGPLGGDGLNSVTM